MTLPFARPAPPAPGTYAVETAIHADRSRDRATLHELAARIVDPARPRDSLCGEAIALSGLLERLTGILPAEVAQDFGANQTVTDGGLAISPIRAALCAREVLRTVTFIRGLAAAIDQVRLTRQQNGQPSEQPGGQQVHVLYAGCGPFATLALPLMTLFDAKEVRFTLLDIHAASLDCARGLVDTLGLQAHVADYLLADACTLQLDPAALPDVIVSETMNTALGGEPQVAIMRQLAQQAPAALLVPESVTVEACLLRPGRELPPPLDHPDAVPQPARRERIDLGPVFRLDAQAIRAWPPGTDALPAAAVQLPQDIPAGFQARLLTKIVAFGAHRLDDYDCSLNLPLHWPGRPVLAGGERVQFAYRLGQAPGLLLV